MAVLFEKRKERRYVVGPANVNPYPVHLHDAVEIVIIRKGFLDMTVNGKEYRLEPDSALMIFPVMTHSYEGASEDADGLFVGFTPGVMDEFHSALVSQWPADPLIKIEAADEDLRYAIEKLSSFSGRKETHPLTLAYIHLLVAGMFMKLELIPASGQIGDSFMHEVLNYIQQHSDEDLSLDAVAKGTGVGKSCISHLFSQKLKINFRRFLNAIRVEKACILLEDPERSIKEVCYECGFESTRTFHRVFLEEQKMTPREYRERKRQGKATENGQTEES